MIVISYSSLCRWMKANFSRGLASWRRRAMPIGYCFFSMSLSCRTISSSRFSRWTSASASLWWPWLWEPSAGKGLLHIASFLIECPLPQVDLPRVQAKLSLQVGFGFTAALEQSQCFKLEFSAVYFLRWHLGLLGCIGCLAYLC